MRKFLVLALLASNLSAVHAGAKTIMDCYGFGFKLEKNFFGLKTTVSEKLLGYQAYWRPFCKQSELSVDGPIVSCTKRHKSYLRINPNKIVAEAQMFLCPAGSELPNKPIFRLIKEAESGLPEGYELPIFVGSNVYTTFNSMDPMAIVKKDPLDHFESQRCEFYGPIKKIPAIELSEDGKTWRIAEFPESYPLITLRKNAYKRDSISSHDVLYERLIFGDLGTDYERRSGTKYLTVLDFDTSEIFRSNWAIDPDTDLPLGEQNTNNGYRCIRLENAD